MSDGVTGERRRIAIRDCTLREGRDVPGVEFSIEQCLTIARALAEAGVTEIELVAPARIAEDLPAAARLRSEGLPLTISGLVYAARPDGYDAIRQVTDTAGRCDLLMPLADQRAPRDRAAKRRLLQAALDRAASDGVAAGAGFPNATQVEPAFVLEMCEAAVAAGADRLTVYDTNGSADPFGVLDLFRSVSATVAVPVFFHGHNDLGLAVANAYAAVRGGAHGLDVTVNGIGDRAGNASLEQVAMLLHLRGFDTGIALAALAALSARVAAGSGVPVPALAPIVGAFVATHKSAGHMEALEVFEAFDVALVGLERKTTGG
jgi:homocitrate synthase NifV